MPARADIDRDQTRDQEQRPGKRSRTERLKLENRVRRGLDDGRGSSRIGRMRKHRDDGLKNAQRFMRARMLRRGLGVGVRGKRGQAGKKESSEAHKSPFTV